MPTIPTDYRLYGLLADRPAAGIAGRSYWVTDSGLERETLDTGSTWLDLNVAATWAPGSGGGGSGAITLISDQIITEDTEEVDFDLDFSTYRAYLLLQAGFSDYGSQDQYYLRINDDAGAVYWSTLDVGGLGFSTGNTQGGTGSDNAALTVTVLQCPTTDGYPVTAVSFGGNTGTDGAQLAEVQAGGYIGGTAAATLNILVNQGTNWLPGSRFTLYGLS